MKSIVLNSAQISQKTERIAFEILENTFEADIVFIAGIEGNGYLFAERVVEQLAKHSEQEIRLFKITVNKNDPRKEDVVFSIPSEDLDKTTVVVIDDVINSGRTMVYAVKALLENDLAMLKVATLVNRTHRKFPVSADFVGVNISTTIQDNIVVELDKDAIAYLE